MRYSIPLFSSGANVWTKPDPKRSRGSTPATMPQLSYKVMQQNGRRWLEITNQGAVHARISKLNKVAGGRPITVADGLVGYVLPHSSMRLPIPSQPAIANGNRLEAMINHNSSPVVIKPAK
jgi:fimbrial chaperone protein